MRDELIDGKSDVCKCLVQRRRDIVLRVSQAGRRWFKDARMYFAEEQRGLEAQRRKSVAMCFRDPLYEILAFESSQVVSHLTGVVFLGWAKEIGDMFS